MKGRTFKGLPVCSKHDVPYHWKEGCKRCKAEKKPSKMKPLDEALMKIEEEMKKDKCDFCNKNKAMEGHSYRFKPICHDCCYTKSPRYKEQYDKNSIDNN